MEGSWGVGGGGGGGCTVGPPGSLTTWCYWANANTGGGGGWGWGVGRGVGVPFLSILSVR